MFYIVATFEDLQIQAKLDPFTCDNYSVSFHDAESGCQKNLDMTPLQLSYVLAINLDLNGTPTGYEDMYKVLEPLFKDWPPEFRPIP